VKSSNKKLLSALIISLNLFLIAYIYLRTKSTFPSKLPNIIINAVDGKYYDLGTKEHYKLLYFIESYDMSSIESIQTLLSFIKIKNIDSLDIAIFSEKPRILYDRFSDFKHLIIAHNNEFITLKHSSRSHIYFYDKKGFLLNKGLSCIEPKKLIWLINDTVGDFIKSWRPSEIVEINENIASNRYLRFLARYLVNSGYSVYVIIFLDDACSLCPSGEIVDDMNKAQMENPNAKYYLALSTDYNDNDLRNIKYNNNMKLDFIRTDNEIVEFEKASIQTNLVSTINGFSIVLNKDGAVLYFTDIFNERDRFMPANYESLRRFLNKEKAGFLNKQRG
jgi:hypothetical protein